MKKLISFILMMAVCFNAYAVDPKAKRIVVNDTPFAGNFNTTNCDNVQECLETIDGLALGGEANTASNLGGGLASFDSKSLLDLRFNSFAASDFDLASNLLSLDATLKGNWNTAYGWGDHSTQGYITATLTQEQVDDYVDALINDIDSVHTLITITYDDINDAMDFVVESDLALYSWANVDATDLKVGSVTQAYSANLDTYSGIAPSANAQTLLGQTFAQMQASLSVDDLITLSGVSEGSVNLGTFTGTTISDSRTIKQALQDLETAHEAITHPVEDTAYGAGWNGDTTNAPSQNAVYDEMETKYSNDEDITVADGKSIILDDEPASDHGYSGIVSVHQADVTCAIGDVVSLAADGNYDFGDADAAATSTGLKMCVESITATNTGKMLDVGYVRDDTWAWTVGGRIYLSITGTTGNTLTQTAPSATGDQVVVVGVATHADRMYFNPSSVLVEVA